MKFILSTLILTLFSTIAYANDGGPAPITTIGGMIATMGTDIWKPFLILLWGSTMLIGVYLVASSLFRLVSSVGREDIPYKEIILRLLGGGFMVAAWDTLQMGPMTMFGSAMTTLGWSPPSNSVGAFGDCTKNPAGGADAITCMAGNVASNIVPVALSATWALAFLWGAWLVFTAIHSAATASERGGNQNVKPFPRILFGGILCSLPYFISSVSSTLGYSNPVITGGGIVATTSNMLLYTPATNWGLMSNYGLLLGKIFIILAMFGAWSVLRGIHYLRADAEGAQRGAVGAGITHIIGGAMLINSKATTCFFMNTLIGTGLNFCS